jgi:hypothetical protein
VTFVLRNSRLRTLHIGALVVLILAACAYAVVGSGKASAGTLAVDVQVTTHQSPAAASITSPVFSTHSTNEVLLAFLTSDGPNKAAGESFSSVTGGGLTWSLRARANGQPGTAEIWQAVAPQTLTNVSVTAMRASGSYVGAITVVSFSGADTSRTGATASGNAGTGAPGVSLTTTVAGSWVWGVGDDWSNPIPRTPGANQTVADQDLSPTGDTYWVQSQNAVTANAGTSVTINDTAPANDKWNLAAVEVVPQGSTGTTPPTAPTNLAATVVSGTEVDLSWTASSSSVGIAGYTVTRNSVAIGTSPNPTYNDTTVSAGTTYTYTVSAFDAQGNVSGPSNSVTVTTPTVGLDQTGQWGSLINWPIVAMHGDMLPDGKILTWGDSKQGDTAVVWDPATNTFTNVPDAFSNPACGGNNALPDGRIIDVGGGGVGSGQANTTVSGFNEAKSAWAQLASNAFPTWYASTTVLPNGNLIRIGGVKGCNNCNPEVPEVYSPATDQWTTLSNNPTLLPMYPFTYVRPDGTVAVTGASEVTSALRIYDPATQTWTTSDPNVVDGGSAAMYDTGKVLKAGSATEAGLSGSSAATAYTTDLGQATPTWTQTGSMAYPRSYLNLTPLPDGTVLATGGETTKDGGNLNNGVLPAENWNPATGKWTTWASMAVPRLYHSIGMLLPDGRVFVAGTGDLAGVPNEYSAQIFSPPYLFKGPRPTIASSPSVVQYGSNFQVSTPDASSISSVSLIRTAAVTHSFDQSTRRVSLPFSASNGTLNVQAPANGAAAPPGNYMLFIVNGNGVPSVASWVHLPAPYEDNVAPSAPTGLTATAASSSSVNLSWTASTDNVGVTGYNILRGGTKVGTSTTTSYTDNGLASNTKYTYTVTAFDAAGNVSQPSSPATVTTPADTTPPVISNVAASPNQTTATITWTTDKPSSSQVAYGTTSAYGSTTPLDSTLVTAHSQTISGLTPGQQYHFSVASTDGSGNSASSPDSTFTTLTNVPLAIDAQISVHTTSAAATITSPAFNTKQPNELLEAFIATDGGSSPQTISSVTGGGLTWTLRSRANGRPGTSEIWQAVAPAALSNVTVKATLSSSRVGAVTVLSFTGASTSVNGATVSAGAASGAPTASLTTTRANSWVFAVGDDYSNAIARTVGANQTLVDQDLAPVGDTYWVQRQNTTTPNSGTSVTMNDTAPTTDQWNLALIEIPPS